MPDLLPINLLLITSVNLLVELAVDLVHLRKFSPPVIMVLASPTELTIADNPVSLELPTTLPIYPSLVAKLSFCDNVSVLDVLLIDSTNPNLPYGVAAVLL